MPCLLCLPFKGFCLFCSDLPVVFVFLRVTWCVQCLMCNFIYWKRKEVSWKDSVNFRFHCSRHWQFNYNSILANILSVLYRQLLFFYVKYLTWIKILNNGASASLFQWYDTFVPDQKLFQVVHFHVFQPWK